METNLKKHSDKLKNQLLNNPNKNNRVKIKTT